MADIRINALATTAASTASDDFIAVDGSANGTRKLNAYSPTFGGNLTVSGTAGIGGNNIAGQLTIVGTPGTDGSAVFNQFVRNTATAATSTPQAGILFSGYYSGTSSFANFASIQGGKANATDGNDEGAIRIVTKTNAGSLATRATFDSTATTISGNLTVSGGSIGVGGAVGSYFDILQGGNDAYAYNRRAGQLIFGTNNTTVMQFASNGNCLIGTSTDGGQKLQVSGTAYVSGTTVIGGGLDVAGVIATNTNMVLNAYTGAGNIVLKTNGTTALTLDSSQRCILSGALRLANTYVATPQVSTGYVTIQDSTGTTYKVLVAT